MIVRYFLFDGEFYMDADAIAFGGAIVECTQLEWEACPHNWPITYERHTIRENGVSQICLTKAPDF